MISRKIPRYAVITFSAVILMAPSAQATLFTGFPQGSETQALTIEDESSMAFSFIVNNKVDSSLNTGVAESPETTRLCDAFNTRGCNLDQNADLSINSILPVCGEVQENCIEGLSFIKSDETIINASFDRYFKGKTFTTPTELAMPGGSRLSMWNADGMINQGGTNQYAVQAQLNWNYKNGRVDVSGFSASVVAIKPALDSRYKDSGVVAGPAFNGVYGSITETGEFEYDGSCVAVEAGMCGKKVEFAPNTRIKLKLRISNKVTGWLHGRISHPEISVTPIDAKNNQLIVAADVVEVPMMYAQYKPAEMSSNFQRLSDSRRSGHGLFGKTFYWQYPPDVEFSFVAVNELAPLVKNTATEVHSYWNVASIDGNGSQKCLADTSKLVGFVTTNAMAYAGRAPDWNDGTLEYKVAGLHYLPDGKTLTSGTYDLAMRSDAARCLYGFTSAPISATISVISAEGDQKVATTVLNEKNGWLYLAAYGFSFSSPTIKIKLSQQKPIAEAPNPTRTSADTSTKVAVKIINCVKGKTVKTVKGTNPKCPAGYKAK